MWPFRPAPADPILDPTKRLSTADYLCRLMEEQNSLLRAFLVHAGVTPPVPRTSQVVHPRAPRTAEHVTRVTREDQLQVERKRREEIEASWRTGPDSAPTPTPAGSGPNGQGAPSGG